LRFRFLHSEYLADVSIYTGVVAVEVRKTAKFCNIVDIEVKNFSYWGCV